MNNTDHMWVRLMLNAVIIAIVLLCALVSHAGSLSVRVVDTSRAMQLSDDECYAAYDILDQIALPDDNSGNGIWFYKNVWDRIKDTATPREIDAWDAVSVDGQCEL